MGRKGEFRERERGGRRIREGISTRHGRCGVTRARRRYVPTKRTTREVYSEDAIRVVGQKVRSEILGKIRKELEAMEGQEAGKKRDNEGDPRRRRNRGRKIRSKRVDRRKRRQNG